MTSHLTTFTVLNPDIAPQTMAKLLRLHDPDQGVVVCHPVPPGARANHLAHDVLHALGKRPWASGWPRAQAAVEKDIRRWLDAERISDLLLVRADLFAPDALERIATLAGSSGTRTWLIFDSARQRRAANDALDAIPKTRVEITSRVEAERTTAQLPSEPWPSPSLWLARAAAAMTFTPEAFQDLDTHIWKAHSAAERWLVRHKTLAPDRLGRFLEAITRAPDGRHRYARVIGANSALLVSGLAAEVHDLTTPPRPTVSTPTPEQDAVIRCHSNPAAAALYALAILTDLDDTTLSGLSLDQIGANSGGVSLGGYVLRGAAAAALRAHYALMTGGRMDPLTNRLFTPSQIRAHKGPWGTGPPANGGAIEVRLARLDDSIDITHPQPQLDPKFKPPAPGVRREAGLIVRLLGLTPTRALTLRGLTEDEEKATRRLAAVDAVRLYDGRVYATETLRFSYYLSNTTRYLVERGGRWA
jgi:hypothetical protein